MQVTLWGSQEANNAAISDYASKQWSGLVGSYHLPLWEAWLAKMKTAASAGAKTVPDVSLELVQQAEKWINSTRTTILFILMLMTTRKVTKRTTLGKCMLTNMGTLLCARQTLIGLVVLTAALCGLWSYVV